MSAQRAGGGLRLFRLFGINVYLHWTWFILVYIELRRHGWYSSTVWNILELVAIFGIILLHEFGHALACRSVGGKAERIMLWPLGGVAYVQPPARPGAVLWSIAAGPLVNIVLAAPLFALAVAGNMSLADPLGAQGDDFGRFVAVIAFVNVAILCFNLLPIYPLDGGQIVQSILWFFLGRALSLRIVAFVGIIAAIAGGMAALYFREYWYILLAAFVGWQSFHGYRVARFLAAQEQWERTP